MGVLFDYFAAPDDAAAAGVVEQGPADFFDTVSTQIDCVVQLAYVEELLGGRSFAAQLDDPRTGGVVAQRPDGEVVVLTISDAMRAALARAPDAELPRVARAWADAEEFGGAADPDELETIVRELCALARTAADAGHALYCWASV